MNKLQSTDLGGIPLEWDDLRWESDAIREALLNLVKGFSEQAYSNMVIWGCDVSGAGHTAGAVLLNGEICTVDALATLPTPGVGQVLHFQLTETDDPSGTETMQNGSVTNQYKIRKAVVVASNTPGSNPLFGSIKLTRIITPINEPSSTYTIIPTLISLPVSGSFSTASGVVRYAKVGRRIFINFQFQIDITSPCLQVNLDLAGILNGVNPSFMIFGVCEAFNTTSIPCFFNFGDVLSPKVLKISKEWGVSGGFGTGLTTFRGQFIIEIP